jgi:hypothetical protein
MDGDTRRRARRSAPPAGARSGRDDRSIRLNQRPVRRVPSAGAEGAFSPAILVSALRGRNTNPPGASDRSITLQTPVRLTITRQSSSLFSCPGDVGEAGGRHDKPRSIEHRAGPGRAADRLPRHPGVWFFRTSLHFQPNSSRRAKGKSTNPAGISRAGCRRLAGRRAAARSGAGWGGGIGGRGFVRRVVASRVPRRCESAAGENREHPEVSVYCMYYIGAGTGGRLKPPLPASRPLLNGGNEVPARARRRLEAGSVRLCAAAIRAGSRDTRQAGPAGRVSRQVRSRQSVKAFTKRDPAVRGGIRRDGVAMCHVEHWLLRGTGGRGWGVGEWGVRNKLGKAR